MVAINGAEDTEAASSLRLIYLDDHLPHDPLVNHFNLTYLGQTPGKVEVYPGSLRAKQDIFPMRGTSPITHIRNFLDCVKTRALPASNANVAVQSHVACHAANIALFLGRKVTYDPKRNEFPGDEQANRLRSEALREPWRI